VWTEFVRERGQRKDDKRAKKPRSPAELEAALDDLVREAESRPSG
jgi:hypothetical protein